MNDALLAYFEKNGSRLDFFGAVSLLEELFAERGITDPIEKGRILFRPDHAISFPPSDIAEFEAFEDRYRFTLSFMGLSGISSPLPVYFSETIARNEAESAPLHDFLTIFNNRMYALFYKAWKKYQLLRVIDTAANDPLMRCIAALAGITLSHSSAESEIRMLAYAGLLTSGARGTGGLCSLFSDFFNGVAVEIKEFMPSWVSLANPTTLGSAETAQLGVSAMSGTSVYDCSGSFRVVIGPMERKMFESFLVMGENLCLAKKLVNAYLAEPLDYDFELLLQVQALIPVELGSDRVRLGETATLGGSFESGEIKSQLVAGRCL